MGSLVDPMWFHNKNLSFYLRDWPFKENTRECLLPYLHHVNTSLLEIFFFQCNQVFWILSEMCYIMILCLVYTCHLSTSEPCDLGKLLPCPTLFPWRIMLYKWVDLCSNKNLFMGTEICISYNFHRSWNILLFFFQHLKLKKILNSSITTNSGGLGLAPGLSVTCWLLHQMIKLKE